MRRGGLSGIFFFLVLTLWSAPPPSPFGLDQGWQTVVAQALREAAAMPPGDEDKDSPAVADWLRARLWEKEEPWPVFRDEALRDLKQRRLLLRTARSSFDRQRQERETLLEELTQALETEREVPRLAQRVRALRPVLPPSNQLTVAVTRAPGSGATMESSSPVASPVVPAPYTKSLAETIEQLRGDLEVLATQLGRTEEDLALIDRVAPDDFAVLRTFLSDHYDRALAAHRAEKKRLRFSAEAPEED